MGKKYIVVVSDFDEGYAVNYEFSTFELLEEYLNGYELEINLEDFIGGVHELVEEWLTFTIIEVKSKNNGFSSVLSFFTNFSGTSVITAYTFAFSSSSRRDVLFTVHGIVL